MKLNTLEVASVLLLAAVLAYSAGSVSAHGGGTDVLLAGDWQAAFTVEHAFPPGDGVGRTAAARVHIGDALPEPSRSTANAAPDALRGDLGVFGLRGHALRGAEVRRAHGDSVQVTLGTGTRAVVLTGRLECGRFAGHWRHASRVQAETGRFELRRDTARGSGSGGVGRGTEPIDGRRG